VSSKAKVLIVEARFYENIADELAKGAVAVLERAGVSCDRHWVPGVFEVPAGCRFALRAMEEGSASPGYSGFIALGCVIRGETDHYDHICREASRALMDLAVNHSVALGFGILTCETYDQAWVRSAVDQKNKGADAAEACLRMIELRRSLHLVPR
jgi:6,7-dimethyl-8-ribityllumazine synthase